MNTTIYFVSAAVLVAAVAAWTDWKTWEISNKLTLGTLLVAPIAHAGIAFQTGKEGVLLAGGSSLLGAILCGLVPAALYLTGGGRGGDVKLAFAIGALCRPMIGIDVIFYAFIVAMLFAIGKLVFDGKLLSVLGRSAALFSNAFKKKENRKELPAEMMTEMRMGPSFLVGTVLTLLLRLNNGTLAT